MRDACVIKSPVTLLTGRELLDLACRNSAASLQQHPTPGHVYNDSQRASQEHSEIGQSPYPAATAARAASSPRLPWRLWLLGTGRRLEKEKTAPGLSTPWPAFLEAAPLTPVTRLL